MASQYQYSQHISSKITLHLGALSITSMNPPKKTLVVIQRNEEILMCRVQLHQSSHDNHIVNHTLMNVGGHGDFLRVRHSGICSDCIITCWHQFSLQELDGIAGQCGEGLITKESCKKLSRLEFDD